MYALAACPHAVPSPCIISGGAEKAPGIYDVGLGIKPNAANVVIAILKYEAIRK